MGSGHGSCVIRLVPRRNLHIDLRMSGKKIPLSEEAYKILKRAKRSPRESFSEVVLRGSWDESAETIGAALASLEEFGHGKKSAITDEERELLAGFTPSVSRPVLSPCLVMRASCAADLACPLANG